VLFIDTAGIDDVGALGELRIQKTQKVFDRTDLGIIVSESGSWGNFEIMMFDKLRSREIPIIVVFNKFDKGQPDGALIEQLASQKIPIVKTVATQGQGILDLRQALIDSAPADFINTLSIAGDLVGPGEMAVLVIPVDKEAPKGRLILPQVQTIRDLLDSDAYCMMVKERELRDALDRLKRPPKIVITDSQAFMKVSADTPRNILLTSFSILFARFKGDLYEMVRGILTARNLKPGDRILVSISRRFSMHAPQ